MEDVNGKDPRGGQNIKTERNEALVAYYRAGHSLAETARAFAISRARVSKIVQVATEAAKPNNI
jgi:DNA-binding transcriptional regulator LsrR (DeoR family)